MAPTEPPDDAYGAGASPGPGGAPAPLVGTEADLLEAARDVLGLGADLPPGDGDGNRAAASPLGPSADGGVPSDDPLFGDTDGVGDPEPPDDEPPPGADDGD
ncbi:MAG: hypothetical protein IPM45_09750 [Acidimicrobiales bacterium]|nr:hypothetical protein [Acidimicrobiales bacterium]